MTTKKRPETLSDFRKLGKKRLRGVTPEAAKAKHDARRKIDHRMPASLSWWIRNRSPFSNARLPVIHTLPRPIEHDYPKIPSQHSRKQNWNAPKTSLMPTRVLEINEGRYSSRCTYTHYTYTHMIECWGAIVGRYLVYRIDTSSGVKQGEVKAFRGWAWKIDDNGLCMARGKADYHPSADDLLNGMTAGEMAHRARENHQRRIAADREKKHEQRALATTRVTLHDARIAGNCLAGTVRFCQDRLGVRVRSDDPYQTVSAAELLATGDPSAARAVYAAYRRETLVSI